MAPLPCASHKGSTEKSRNRVCIRMCAVAELIRATCRATLNKTAKAFARLPWPRQRDCQSIGVYSMANDFLFTSESVSEGVYSARTVVQRAQAAGVDMPIASAVLALLDGRMSAQAAVRFLLERDPKHESL